jgi:hypothetical protein
VARKLPAHIARLLPKTAGGKPAVDNQSLYNTFAPRSTSVEWHRAQADAKATAVWLMSDSVRPTLLGGSLDGELVSLAQVTLQVYKLAYEAHGK